MNDTALTVEIIPINQINILNPAAAAIRLSFQSIISNISNPGPKATNYGRSTALGNHRRQGIRSRLRPRPSQSIYRPRPNGDSRSLVKDASREECLLMSLVENIARRQIRP